MFTDILKDFETLLFCAYPRRTTYFFCLIAPEDSNFISSSFSLGSKCARRAEKEDSFSVVCHRHYSFLVFVLLLPSFLPR